MARGHRGTGNTLRLFGRLRAFGAETPSVLGDRGAVAVEFAVVFPVLLLMLVGIFGVGVVMIQDMELNFVVENAAMLQAAGGNGMAYATAQLAPPVSFTFSQSASCGVGVSAAQVTGTWPVSLGVLDTVPLTLSATATACPPK
jgi:Flp pilus assembly protein TadG